MADNPYEVLKSLSPELVKKLNENFDVCDFLIAFYKHIESVAAESHNDPKNLMCSVDVIQERLLRIRTQYYEASDVNKTFPSRLPKHRMINIVKLFEVNHNVRDVAFRVVEILERWLEEFPYRKEQGWKNLKLVNGMHLVGDHTFTIELVMKIQWDEYVTTRMKWDLPEEQPVEEEAQEEKKPEEPVPDLEWRKS